MTDPSTPAGGRKLSLSALTLVGVSPVEAVSAAAAAIAGPSRWVRAPGPWRFSKFRFEVEAQRSPGAAMSILIPTHIEQLGSHQLKPAS